MTWPQGAQVTVNIDPSFAEQQRAAIRQSYTNWQNASVTNGSGVNYSFTYNSTPPSMFPHPAPTTFKFGIKTLPERIVVMQATKAQRHPEVM